MNKTQHPDPWFYATHMQYYPTNASPGWQNAPTLYHHSLNSHGPQTVDPSELYIQPPYYLSQKRLLDLDTGTHPPKRTRHDTQDYSSNIDRDIPQSASPSITPNGCAGMNIPPAQVEQALSGPRDDSQCPEDRQSPLPTNLGSRQPEIIMSIFRDAPNTYPTICICEPCVYKERKPSFGNITASTTHVVLSLIRESARLIAFIATAKKEIVTLCLGSFVPEVVRWYDDRICPLKTHIAERFPAVSQSWCCSALTPSEKWGETEQVINSLLQCLRRILGVESEVAISSPDTWQFREGLTPNSDKL